MAGEWHILIAVPYRELLLTVLYSTTGGTGGTTTTVSTLAQFTAAAESSNKMVIVVKGSISGNTKVRVKSNKSIIGASGSSKLQRLVSHFKLLYCG